MIQEIRLLAEETYNRAAEIDEQIRLVRSMSGTLAPEKIEQLSGELHGKRAEVLREGRASIHAECSRFMEEAIPPLFSVDASKITDDAKLLDARVKLDAAEVEELFARNEGNGLMRRMIAEYASENCPDADVPYFSREQVEKAARSYADAADMACSDGFKLAFLLQPRNGIGEAPRALVDAEAQISSACA